MDAKSNGNAFFESWLMAVLRMPLKISVDEIRRGLFSFEILKIRPVSLNRRMR